MTETHSPLIPSLSNLHSLIMQAMGTLSVYLVSGIEVSQEAMAQINTFAAGVNNLLVTLHSAERCPVCSAMDVEKLPEGELHRRLDRAIDSLTNLAAFLQHVRTIPAEEAHALLPVTTMTHLEVVDVVSGIMVMTIGLNSALNLAKQDDADEVAYDRSLN